MKAATIQEIKKEMHACDLETVQALCLRLAKYKKENKELLTYLLFEANDEEAYIENAKEDMRKLFMALPTNTYLLKKTLRKTLRFANKQIKYSGIKKTELEIRIFFCLKMKEAKIPLSANTVLYNLYHQQIKKIESVLAQLPEDLQGDYEQDMKIIL
jgi:hypothetical protein